ncbi:GNAT family N-acetyltransferase [Vibrio sp. D431a]|uniref:GNAT family N-acetyltransferase n=1 Tax=Vibrio sp. D431a TaxID=2837388 RepID=UPI00255589C6|nr:GNAT family N-acetyltransferase [Vibrio sp. D431a]MDK9789840.1 GNAT family N-acetyltransferase [Vibrio sp. D431a]
MDNNYTLVDAIEGLTVADFDPWMLANNAGIGITSDRTLQFVVLDDKDQAVGVGFSAVDGDKFEFDVAVMEGVQGGGIGTAIVDALIELYEQENIDGNLTLETYVVNPAMEHILKKKGFEVSRLAGDTVYMKKSDSLGNKTRLYHATSSDYDEFDLRFTTGQLGIHLGTLEQVREISEELLEDEGEVFLFEVDIDTSDISKIARLTDQGAWSSASALHCASRMLGAEVNVSGGEREMKSLLSSKGVKIVRYENAFEGNGTEDSFIVLDLSYIKGAAKHAFDNSFELDNFLEERAEHQPVLPPAPTRFENKLKRAISSQSSNKPELAKVQQRHAPKP